MLHQTLAALTAESITALVADGIRESRTLEFKREVWNTKDVNKKREMVADIMAFANSNGGDIVLGVEEAEEVAVAATGVAIGDATDLSTSLAQILASNLEPPLRGIDCKVIPTRNSEDRAFVVIRIPRSHSGPHRDTSTRIFYERTPSGKTPMDIDALRSSFLQHEIVLDRFDRFRMARLNHLNGMNVWGHAYPLIALHAVPLHALSRHAHRQVDFASLRPEKLANIEAVDKTTFNADGFLRYTKGDPGHAGCGFQIFHNGSYEAVAGGNAFRGPPEMKVLPESTIVRLLVNCYEHLRVLDDHLGISPLLVSISAWYLVGARLGLKNRIAESTHTSTGFVLCPETRLDMLPDSPLEFGKIIEATLTPLFTTFNLPTPHLDPNRTEWGESCSRR